MCKRWRVRCARSTQIEHFFFVPLARRRIYATNKRRLDSKKLPLPSIQQHFDKVKCMFVCLARVTELVHARMYGWIYFSHRHVCLWSVMPIFRFLFRLRLLITTANLTALLILHAILSFATAILINIGAASHNVYRASSFSRTHIPIENAYGCWLT